MSDDNLLSIFKDNKEEALLFYASVFGENGAEDIFKILEDMTANGKDGAKQSMMIDVKDEMSAQSIFKALSTSGDWFTATENEFIYTCELKDKFGVEWLLYYSKPYAS